MPSHDHRYNLHQCLLPWPPHYTIFPYWDDLYLVNSGSHIHLGNALLPTHLQHRVRRILPGSGRSGLELSCMRADTLRRDLRTVTNGNTSATAGCRKTTPVYPVLLQRHGGAPRRANYILQAVALRRRHQRRHLQQLERFATPTCAPGHTRAVSTASPYPITDVRYRLCPDAHALYVLVGVQRPRVTMLIAWTWQLECAIARDNALCQ